MSNSVIEEARKRRLQKEEEASLNKDTQSFNNFDKTYIEWVGLKKEQEVVVRVVGDPFETPDRKPTDVKIILFSEWLNDEGTGFVKINWPFLEEGEKFKPDPNWLMTRLYNAINAGGWENYTPDMISSEKEIREKDGKIVNKFGRDSYWKNSNTAKTCFKRIDKANNRKPNDKFPRNVYPAARVLMNVIDRHDDWCAENKKTKVLSSSVSPFTIKKDTGEDLTIYYTDRGVPLMVYKKLWDDVVNHRGHWNTVDVVITKKKMDYTLRDALEDKISEASKKIANANPLTDQELAYELWDLDERFKPLTYYGMKKNLLNRFKQTDLDLGTHFEEELNDLAADETREMKEKKDSRDKTEILQVKEEIATKEVVKETVVETPVETVTETTTEEVIEDVVEEVQTKVALDDAKEETKEVVKEESKRERRVETSETSIESLPFWNNLVQEDQDDVTAKMESFDGTTITWKGDTRILPCDKCNKDLPSTVLNCPYCGAQFQSS